MRRRTPGLSGWTLLFPFALIALTLTAATALAKRAPDRSDMSAALRAIPAPDLAVDAVMPLSREGPAQVQYGTSGVLRRYWLRQPGGVTASGAPFTVARDFLEARASLLGLSPGHLDRDLEAFSEKASPSGTHLRWQQVVNGVPVWHSEIVVKVSNRGEVSSVQNNLTPGLAVSTTPSIDKAQALEAALAELGPRGKSIGEFSSVLQVVPFAGGARLAYVVSLPVESPMGDWRVFVDAKSGKVIALEDAMVYATGTGQVFDPDPMSKMNDSTFVDNADANTSVPFPGAYDIITLEGLTLTAGTYSLDGPFARLIDNESPVVAPVTATQPDSFRYQRSPSGFEDVMCYYQLDKSQRYIQSLGFISANNRVQQVDSHGLSGADNSHYVPSTGNVAFGEGGVDDDEDADVIWHEYGHSIQDNIVPGWGGGQEGAMGEGFGDYWAGSYSLSLFPAFQINRVFTWDGNGETWTGRPLINIALHYPANCCGEVHDSGTLWCSGLMDCWWTLGRTVMDRLVLDHHFALGTSATMADAANQIIQSDIDLYGGAHLATLVAKFGFWGFVNPADFVPTITHTPLADTENTTGPYPVVATITSTQPLDASSLKVYWGIGAITDSLPMTATLNPNEFSASIPGPLSGVDVRYYIRARDTGSGVATHPAGAPANYHQFHIGADVTAPVIAHTPIADTPQLQWPKTVLATVTDNLGVNHSSVLVSWTFNTVPKASFSLARVGLTTSYSGVFPSLPGDVSPGDVIAYHITAADAAGVPNISRSPSSGEHSFSITSSLGAVLVLDDDEVAKRAVSKVLDAGKDGRPVEVTEAAGPGDGIASANVIAGILNGLGYVATVEAAATSNPATWSTYSFIVSASGANLGPVAIAGYRTALESYVAAGGKLVVEGGEVVFDAVVSPGYPTFAANVLHAGTWAADNAGSLLRLAPQAFHPIAILPNALGATLPITYTGFGSEDSYQAAAPAYIVYGVTAQPGNGGILVYDDTPAPQSAQIVLLGFNLKQLGDAALRTNLIQNVGAYLLAPESAPNSSVSGAVAVGLNPDHSGVSVTALPGGASTSTNTAGAYSLTGLYSGTYLLTFSKAGYRSETRIVVLGPSQVLSGVNVYLYPQPSESACASPALAIPDNNPVGVTSNVTVAQSFAVSGVNVDINLTHTFRGDLIVELRHGAKTVRLHNRTGGSADNLIGNYPATLTVNGPGALNDFAGDPANGSWTLFISDNANIDVGTLVSWCVNVQGAADTTLVLAVGDAAPRKAALMAAMPNPLHEAGTTLRYVLPRAAEATLGVYDVSGRLVRSLHDGPETAGEHSLRWDGRASGGRQAPAGIYLVRFRSEGFEAVQRIAMLR